MGLFKRKASVQKMLPKPRANAMIFCERLKARGFDYVEPDKIPSGSFERRYTGVAREHNNHWLHVLTVDRSGAFRTVRGQEAAEGVSPTDLYMAHNCAPEVTEVYNMSMPLVNKIGIGVLVALCIVIIIVIFLIVSTLIGGQ